MSTLTNVQLRIDRCFFCHEHLPTGRRDRKTCSARCRMRLSRWRKRLDLHHKNATAQLTEIGEYLAYPDAVAKAAQLLNDLEAQISSIRAKYRVVKVKAS